MSVGTRLGRAAAVWLLLLPLAAAAGPVAVLDFELLDLTGTGPTTAEVQRTATLRPQLEQALTEGYGLPPAPVGSNAQRRANQGFGYLFDHPDLAAALGREAGARWVVVGRVHKPSFLFVYLKARVVDARSGQLVGEPVVEVKGQQGPGTRRGVARLAAAIDRVIRSVER